MIPIILAAAVLSAALPSAAVAQSPMTSTVSVGGGIAWTDIDNHELDWRRDIFHRSADSFDSGLSWRIAGERYLWPWLSIVSDYSFSGIHQTSRGRPDTWRSRRFGLDIHAVTASMRGYGPEIFGVDPFIQAGLGWLYVDASQVGTPSGLAITAGAGARIWGSERIGVEFLGQYNKGRAYLGMSDMSDYRYLTTIVSIIFRF